MALSDILGMFSKDLGIDLGTANTLVYIKDKGICISEPSIVAINNKTNQILCVGEEAKKMLGRTPGHIGVIRPLVNGVISDFEITETMLRDFIGRAHQDMKVVLPRPRVVIGIPAIATEVEKKSAHDAVSEAGAREVYLVEEPLAAAIGARLPINEPIGNLIADMGGGTVEIAVIAMGGIVTIKSLKIAGDKFNEDIVNYLKDEFKLIIGEKTAEEVKIAIGSAYSLGEELKYVVRGRDVMSGLPKEVEVSSVQIRQALKKSLKTLVEAVKQVIEETPPELVSDILSRGITLSGGSALLRGLDKLIYQEVKIPVRIADDSLTAVVRGTGIILENLDYYKKFLNFIS